MTGTQAGHAGLPGSLGHPAGFGVSDFLRLTPVSSFQHLLVLGQLCSLTGGPPTGSRQGPGRLPMSGLMQLCWAPKDRRGQQAEDTDSPTGQSSACCPPRPVFCGRRVGL